MKCSCLVQVIILVGQIEQRLMLHMASAIGGSLGLVFGKCMVNIENQSNNDRIESNKIWRIFRVYKLWDHHNMSVFINCCNKLYLKEADECI